MIIKSFTADSAAAALKKVRQEMGGDATVLRTRQLKAGKRGALIEITACIDKPPAAHATALPPDTPPPRQVPLQDEPDVSPPKVTSKATVASFAEETAINLRDTIERIERKLDRLLCLGLQSWSDQDRFGAFEHVHRRLREADFPAACLESFMAALLDEYDNRSDVVTFARKKLVEDLSSMMLPNLTFKPGDKLLFVGPAGAGKSSVMGKLATRLVAQEKQKVNLASLDYHRMAAHEELSSYAEILQVKVSDPLGNMAGDSEDSNTITLIDGPDVPTDPEKLSRLMERIQGINPNYRFAVFSALTRSSDVEELAKRIKLLAPTHVVVTMLDLTARHGSAVAAAKALGVKIALVTNSPGGFGQAEAPDPDALARTLLNTEVSLE